MSKPQKILIIRNDHIGDLFFTTQVFREIKKNIPGCKITLIASKTNRSIVEKNKNIDQILELDMAQHSLKTIWNYFKMALELRKMNFDAGIDLRGSVMNSAFLLWLSGIKTRIGKSDAYENRLMQKLISLFLNVPVFLNYYNSSTHLAKENIEIMNRGLNLHSKNYMPEIITDKQDEKDVNTFLRQNKIKKFICVCPFASIEFKQWPTEKFKELINWLDKFKFKILLMGTSKEEEKLKELASGTKNCRVILNFNLRKLGLLFKKSSLVLGHDGGPIHIAGVAGASVIDLVPRAPPLASGKFVPLGNAEVIWAQGANMNTIKIDTVKKSIKKMLKH